MTTLYWVGGGADWDGTAGSKWSLTSGGAGGQPVPGLGDTVRFDGNSGSAMTIVAPPGPYIGTLDCTGFTGSLFPSAVIHADGDVTLSTGASVTLSLSGTANLTQNGGMIQTLSITGGTRTAIGALSLAGPFDLSYSGAVLKLAAGTTNYCYGLVTSATVLGANAQLLTTTAGVAATVSYTSGRSDLKYLTCQDLAFTGGSIWVASSGFVNNGNITGLTTALPAPGLFFGD